MRYAIFSDVHGNMEALDVVLNHLRNLSPDGYVFLGDAVGYGANPNEVCDVIRALQPISVLGNHDAAVAGRMDYGHYYDAARDALDWCGEQLSADNMRWLQQLPYTDRRGPVEFCHGSPLEPEAFDYLFNTDQVTALLDENIGLAPVTLIGHSHLTVSFRIQTQEQTRVVPIKATEITCPLADPHTRHIITVGSVGQPRDRDPRACCGLFDTETGVYTFYRLAYDMQGARQKIIDAGLPPVFGERLLLGV